MHQNAAGDGGRRRKGWLGASSNSSIHGGGKAFAPNARAGVLVEGGERDAARSCVPTRYTTRTACSRQFLALPSYTIYIVASPPPLPLFGGDIGPEKSPSLAPPSFPVAEEEGLPSVRPPPSVFPKKQEIGKIRPNLSPAIPPQFSVVTLANWIGRSRVFWNGGMEGNAAASAWPPTPLPP